MNNLLNTLALAVAVAVVLGMAISPASGLLHQGLEAWAGLGMIGVGLCLRAQQKLCPVAAR